MIFQHTCIVAFKEKVTELNIFAIILKQAKETGVSAGTVATRKKSKSDFRQKMLTAPNETIHFIVTYQQLLKRVGTFECVLGGSLI